MQFYIFVFKGAEKTRKLHKFVEISTNFSICIVLYTEVSFLVLVGVGYRNFISTCIFLRNQFELRLPFCLINEGFDK